MHQQNPPVAHRDIKVENILLKDRKFKLCDFGSASEEFIDPRSVSENDLDDAFEKYEKYTTFMYRPPEMQDKFSNYEIGLKVDSWMLGWVLFALWFSLHPFQDAQKLAIINAHIFFPSDKHSNRRVSDKMRDLIWHILTPNPSKRPSMKEIDRILTSWDELDEIPINSDAKKLKEEYFRRMHGKPTHQKKQKRAGDLTEHDIALLQEKIRRDQEIKKHEVFVPVYQDYNQKMKEQLYNQASSKTYQKPDRKKRNKVQFETKKSISFEEETKKGGKDFWDDFGSDKKEVKKHTQSSKDAWEDDPFNWDFNQPSKKGVLLLTIIANKIPSVSKQIDPFNFDFWENSKNKHESKEDWFDDFSNRKLKVQKQDESFEFDKKPKEKVAQKEIPKQASKPKNISSYFQTFGKASSTDDYSHIPVTEVVEVEIDDFIDIQKPKEKCRNPLFEDDEEEDEIHQEPLPKNMNSDDLLFGESGDNDTDHLFGFEKKDDNDYYGTIFDTHQEKQGEQQELIKKISSLYEESGLGAIKKDEILKPELPKVLQDHQKEQSKFVPEVHSIGQNFWENLYNPDNYSNMQTQNLYKQRSFQPAAPSKLNKPNISNQSNSTFNAEGWMPNVTKKGGMKEQKNEFKNLGIDYLLQTNIKHA
jgi:hypothetical protein